MAKSVSIIDTSCNCVNKTLPLRSNPYGIAINPAGTRVYITMYYGIAIYDTVTDANLANVSVSGYTQGIAFNADGTRFYLSSQNSNTNTNILSVFDTVSNSPITSVAMEGSNFFSRFIAQVPNPTASDLLQPFAESKVGGGSFPSYSAGFVGAFGGICFNDTDSMLGQRQYRFFACIGDLHDQSIPSRQYCLCSRQEYPAEFQDKHWHGKPNGYIRLSRRLLQR
jgi:hypothetical protein